MNEGLHAPGWNLLKLQRYQYHRDSDLIRLGNPTWETAKFKGTVYDFDTPIDEYLKTYAAQYDTVEFHASFFDAPSERKMTELRKEVEGVNKNFQFLPVIPRRISHELAAYEREYELKEFDDALNCLGPHLGPVILRLPETVAPDQWKSLISFFKIWPKDKRLAVQLTHAEWFKNLKPWQGLIHALRDTKISILIEDRMELPVDPGSLLTSDSLIVRFFGRLNPDDQRLPLWVYRLGEYRGMGIRDSYFILNEEEEMCLPILKRMAHSLGGNVHVPSPFDLNANQTSFQF